MKQLLFLTLLVLALPLGLRAQNANNAIDKYFQQYVEDERFTVVYISPKLFQMIRNLEIDMDDEEAQAIFLMAKNLEGLRILTTEDDVDALYDEALSKINTQEYEMLMNLRDKDEDKVQFLGKTKSEDVFTELLLIKGGGDEFVLMSFVGNISMMDISRLAKSME